MEHSEHHASLHEQPQLQAAIAADRPVCVSILSNTQTHAHKHTHTYNAIVGRGMLWRTIGRHRIWQVEVRELASTALAAMLRLHDEAVLLGLHREFSEWARTKVCMCMCSFEWMMRVHGLGRCTRARVSRHAHR
jgi:hypothetical protein